MIAKFIAIVTLYQFTCTIHANNAYAIKNRD